MVIEKYKQLRLAHRFGGINIIDIHSRCAGFKYRAIWEELAKLTKNESFANSYYTFAI